MNTWRVGVPGLLSWSVLNTWYNNNTIIIYIYYTKYNVNNNIINVVIIKYIVLVSALSLVSNGPSYQSFVRELFRCITLCRSVSVFSYYHVISCDHFPWFLLRGGGSGPINSFTTYIKCNIYTLLILHYFTLFIVYYIFIHNKDNFISF